MTWASDIDARPRGVVVSAHRLVGDDVEASPASLASAAGVDVETYTLASVVASEDGAGPIAARAVIADATVNFAGERGVSLLTLATAGRGYGRSGGGRPMSTARAPNARDLYLARLVRAGEAPRGLARGGYQWLHVATQDKLAKSSPATNCPALVIFERRVWDRQFVDRARGCELGPRMRANLEWIGPVDGLDARRLLVFRAATSEHAARYEQARELLAGGHDLAMLALGAGIAFGIYLLLD